ncbi:ABC transporter ATP-binding protein [Bradyrhizobium sp. AUGA SZCCT0240]|uniref:ABC transporter ATP-binding protein n=1 Tax=Bradyrhizobium sp. AUGA SZCCT0240 TaxID=2807669 RepID=UPI001BAD3C08|nr:ABC transporter ATP-binding protein [Bradyrhizobium sp. AUGA SZCCT0240]MBR1256357.1 ABC transporter ATP-binding protein [Bradyrhizobium sp. AUGA SZCCT0240]
MAPVSVVAKSPLDSGNVSAPSSPLNIEQVDLTYSTSRGPLEAIKSLSFDVAPGEFVSILGPSGCGKSTLLKLVTGLLPPTAGTITLAGDRVRGPRREVGIVFQQPTLLPWKTVIENVLVPIRAMGMDIAPKRTVALELLDMMKLGKFAQHYPSELSGGMQQRVGIARGLIHDPALLLMDEPFAALDALTRELMMDELQRIWMATKKSVLFITHSIPEAVYLSDRIIVLSPRPGRVLQIVSIDLPRPRTVDTMSDPRFATLSKQLRQIFQLMQQP